MLTHSFAAVAAALALIGSSTASPVENSLDTRNFAPNPSCVDYTPFTYAGCFYDASLAVRALPYSADALSFYNMTIDTCIAFCKGNGYRYAGLEYYGECFCGASVNGPQIDESMCNYPCNGNSTQACGGNDILSVYQDPTFLPVNNATIADYLPLGCYTDDNTIGRTVTFRQDSVVGSTLTVETCLQACKNQGYNFAGVEYADECYCGVVLGNSTVPVDASQCNMPCAGNSSESCGGPSRINLYVASDLAEQQPCLNYVGAPPPTSSTTSSSSAASTTTSSVLTTTSSISTTTSSVSTSASITTTKTTSAPSTTSPPKVTTTTTAPAQLCTSVSTPAPTCEYKCGSWCSNPLPVFTDYNSCLVAKASCLVQVTDCFLNAGFPGALSCLQYSSWCANVNSYCGSSSGCRGGKCTNNDCKSQNPPTGPTVTPVTSVFPCAATTTMKTVVATTSSMVPVPTATGICTQPSSNSWGYSVSNPVGGIPLPCLTCNNVAADYNAGNIFKLYTSKNSASCNSYKRTGLRGACQDTCDAQYTSCKNTYAQSCNGQRQTGSQDSYNSAMQKCNAQWNDCYSTNQAISAPSKCTSWNSGW